MTDRIRTSVEQGVCTITLNRPEALNALENTMIATIVAELERAGADPDVRAILLRGEGKAFCAGDDLVDMGTEEHPESSDLVERYSRGYPAIVERMLTLEKPIVVSVRRYALGAGLEMALAADLIVAEPQAKLGLPFVLRGIAAGTSLLPKRAPVHLVQRMLYLGEMITAEDAHRMGVVGHLAEDTDVDELALATARRLAVGATRAIGLMKTALRTSETLSVRDALTVQVGATAASVLTEDFTEGKVAFTQKRDPEFGGR